MVNLANLNLVSRNARAFAGTTGRPWNGQRGIDRYNNRIRAARSSCGSPESILPPQRHSSATGTPLSVNALTKINRRQMIANGWTAKFDRIPLTPQMISYDRCCSVAANRGWMEGRH